jgi:peptidoglycan/xylan/chitin deacetylase (PgdA/CDA1 family)
MKIFILYLCKYSGLFFLSKHLLRKKLLILCYHGFELKNECQFRPRLFIKKKTFERRLKLLSDSSARVLSLDAAIQLLETDSLPDNSVVITIDDGFYSVLPVAFPLLEQYGFPATLYQMTKEMLSERPVPDLLFAYMIETTPKDIILNRYKWGSAEKIELTHPQNKKAFLDYCLSHSEKLDSFEELEQFCIELGDLLGVDYEDIRNSRILTLLSASEVSMLASRGLDIQLHTHTHAFPQNDAEAARLEIQKNRESLERLTHWPLVHFCYPSGEWRIAHWEVLKKEGMKSATTCMSGLNDSNVNMLALNRFLDSEDIKDIVFEAELYRFNEILRILRSKVRRNKVPAGIVSGMR